MSERPDIVVTRDGIWPGVWRWETEVPIVIDGRMRRTKRMSGDAMTKDRAFKKARRAQDTLEVGS